MVTPEEKKIVHSKKRDSALKFIELNQNFRLKIDYQNFRGGRQVVVEGK